MAATAVVAIVVVSALVVLGLHLVGGKSKHAGNVVGHGTASSLPPAAAATTAAAQPSATPNPTASAGAAVDAQPSSSAEPSLSAQPSMSTQPSQSAAPSATSSQPASVQPSSANRVPGPRATVFNLSDGGSERAFGGPTTNSTIFGAGSTVASAQVLSVVCTAYDQSVVSGADSSRLWDYTTAGWLPDVWLNTGTDNPVQPACTGNVHHPVAGASAPSVSAGPFPVITDGKAYPIRRSPSVTAKALRTVDLGDLVVLRCWKKATYVMAPRGLGKAHSNSAWDELQGGGWVPDSYVDSHTNGSAAPPC